jgi:hypothetical protein
MAVGQATAPDHERELEENAAGREVVRHMQLLGEDARCERRVKADKGHRPRSPTAKTTNAMRMSRGTATTHLPGIHRPRGLN